MCEQGGKGVWDEMGAEKGIGWGTAERCTFTARGKCQKKAAFGAE